MAQTDHPQVASRAHVWREPQLWLLLALAGLLFGARLNALTIRGEEPRRARVAYEMLETGDYVVPRQQGQIYLSRPPLQNWTIAAASWLVGGLGVIAIRLPAVLATVGTVGLIYWYARAFTSPAAALVAGAAYATMFQVLELGRLAETEATLTVLVAASLLVWHRGYLAGWPIVATWGAGYALAGLAGLAKGPQGPVYFVAVTVSYLLLVRRDWRMLFHWGHFAGMLALFATVAAWWVPYWLATDSHAALAIWGQNAAIRFANPGPLTMLQHAAAFPLRVLFCTLPWSALLVAYLFPSVRRALGPARPYVGFLMLALLVTLPSCLLAIEARARYFMPLYPCLALLVAPIVEQALAARENQLSTNRVARTLWYHWQGGAMLVLLGVAGAMLVATFRDWGNTLLVQPTTMALLFAAATMAGALVVFKYRGRSQPWAAALSTLAIAALFGFTYTGPRINELARKSANNARDIAALRQVLPHDEPLVSFGRVHHLFAYYYRDTIPAVDWPASPEAIPADVEYFCFEDLAGFEEPPLPFAWETVAIVPCDRNLTPQPDQRMIVGRRLPNSAATAGRAPSDPRR